MIIKIVNKINALQKRSAPEVVAHLLGFKKVWFSQSDTPLHLASFLRVVEDHYKESRAGAKPGTDLLTSTMLEGKKVYYTISQQADYHYRSRKLRYVCPYQFVSLYKRVPRDKNEGKKEDKKQKKGNDRPRGRPTTERFPFCKPHKEEATKWPVGRCL